MIKADGEKRHVLIIRETVSESLISDGVTLAVGAVFVGLGVLLKSDAMQWLGAILTMLNVFARAMGMRQVFTIAEARAELDRIEREARNDQG